MTTEKKKGDDTYDEALQRTMHTVLPPILMEIADLRPLDPIHFLAQRLHEYRTREEGNEGSSIIKKRRSPVPSDEDITDSYTKLVIQEADSADLSSSKKQSSHLDYLELKSCTKLHNEVVALFGRIGDIFDDEDIT